MDADGALISTCTPKRARIGHERDGVERILIAVGDRISGHVLHDGGVHRFWDVVGCTSTPVNDNMLNRRRFKEWRRRLFESCKYAMMNACTYSQFVLIGHLIIAWSQQSSDD